MTLGNADGEIVLSLGGSTDWVIIFQLRSLNNHLSILYQNGLISSNNEC